MHGNENKVDDVQVAHDLGGRRVQEAADNEESIPRIPPCSFRQGVLRVASSLAPWSLSHEYQWLIGAQRE